MKEKICSIVILFCLMFVALSLTSVIGKNLKTVIDQKESPLYKIRSLNIVKEKFSGIIKNIKMKFLGERLFFLPSIIWKIDNEPVSLRDRLSSKTYMQVTCKGITC